MYSINGLELNLLDNGIELLIKILIYFHINKFNFITLNCLINKNLFDIFLFQNFESTKNYILLSFYFK